MFVSARFHIMTTASSHKTTRPVPNESEMSIYRCDKCRKFDLLTKSSKERTNRRALETGALNSCATCRFLLSSVTFAKLLVIDP